MNDQDDVAATYRAAYDDQLRTEAETPGAVEVTRHGPLRLAVFGGGRGFVTYRDLGGADAAGVADLVAHAAAYYRGRPDITRVEWKTRGHDHAPGLEDALRAHGFLPDEPESIMIGEARLLARDADGSELQPPEGVEVVRVTDEADVRAMCAMQDEVFGDEPSDDQAEAVLHRLRSEAGAAEPMELWVARADGLIVSAGRLEPVPGTEFAGLWGGATRPAWRGRGIYRALTAARARSALGYGKRYLHSDSTEFSRPILERSGMVRVSTTTPWEWVRGRAG